MTRLLPSAPSQSASVPDLPKKRCQIKRNPQFSGQFLRRRTGRVIQDETS